MRWFYVSIGLCLTATAAWFVYLGQETRELQVFCSRLALGATVVQVRESAQEEGFLPKMEPYAQMRIEPATWMPRPPSCRVFFNRERTIEYRVWQSS